jgi:hypothetical protein
MKLKESKSHNYKILEIILRYEEDLYSFTSYIKHLQSSSQ